MTLLPIFIGQSVVALIIIVTHLGLYIALRHMRELVDDTNVRVRQLEKEGRL